MVKINFVTARHKKRKKILKLAKGYVGSKSTLFRTAKEQVMRSLQYAYRDRRQKKRNFRKIWITRINAGCLNNNISYSKFIHGLALSKIEINRKMLADMAYNEPQMFVNYVNVSKKALEQKDLNKEENITKKENISTKEIKKTKDENIEQENLSQENLNKKTLVELKKIAQKHQIKNISKLKKIDLINLLKK
ncbi:50S ribosomal protein L20 [Columbia Basin potato purple top phytoplasma]|uniref:Large ribosomal subunit protein bL20 n=1 Tax=Columbia Basin potato purple top phytoplasma TaxID=307134 RepID=A0ABT5LBT7_9MOLU|nr:50S ribosomal protein L20 [Columbia Basin potato purple top phytoplasma]MDC9032073.1 50S ribosomal protein L20 [Columbia Basin potato purple top phytoplasma]